ncbi:unnamed protein product [Anisakis simplex]|uniref:Olfactomedin-like domain-containing protein n=1 Tax=Anisakis simplex TaxID=6269 RepID=A0A0M3JYM6_ANISI|nr:unnamed protein product [Anisakis simplex]
MVFLEVRMYPKGCARISSISNRIAIAKRLSPVGGVIRQGERWFLSEYAFGYSILEYANQSSLKHSRPSRVHWFENAPHFDGTDNAICDRQLFYYSKSLKRLYALPLQHFKSRSSSSSSLPSSPPFDSKYPLRSISIPPFNSTPKPMLYAHSLSLVDLESEYGHVWVLYRTDAFLKVIKLECSTMVIIRQWTLREIYPKELVNAFVACGFLYTITQESDKNVIHVVYDFDNDVYVKPSKQIGHWRRYGIGTPSNAQYDSISKTINIFDSGLIHSIATKQ